MEKNKSNKGVIILLVVIIVILSVLCVLFATQTITLNIKPANDNQQTSENNQSNATNSQDTNNEQTNSRSEIVAKLKETLTNDQWVKDNLYTKENCFGETVTIDNRKLEFEVLSDEQNNPIIIVSDYSDKDFVNAYYTVYVENGKTISEMIGNEHPSHGFFAIDKEKNLIIYEWMHMGSYTFKAYDIKQNKINVIDEYSCKDGDNCNTEYDGKKNYNISYISLELTDENVNNYIK